MIFRYQNVVYHNRKKKWCLSHVLGFHIPWHSNRRCIYNTPSITFIILELGFYLDSAKSLCTSSFRSHSEYIALQESKRIVFDHLNIPTIEITRLIQMQPEIQVVASLNRKRNRNSFVHDHLNIPTAEIKRLIQMFLKKKRG